MKKPCVNIVVTQLVSKYNFKKEFKWDYPAWQNKTAP